MAIDASNNTFFDFLLDCFEWASLRCALTEVKFLFALHMVKFQCKRISFTTIYTRVLE